MRRFRLWAGAAVAVAAISISATTQAQSVRGQLAGSVTDPTGAVVSGAQIKATDVATGVSATTVSTSSGSYQFPELPLGTYSVTVIAPGFKTATYSDVVVQVNTTTALNVKLTLGQSTESVTVTAAVTGIQTESSDVSGVVTDRQITQLPLALGGVGNLRSPEAFTFLLPGSTGPGAANSNNGIFISKLAGGQNFGNEVLLDGASQTRSENGSSFDEEAPSVEALQEFKVTTAIPSAEYGRTTGGVENFVTKSGTNSFHGTAYDILRNGAMDANTWFNNGYRAINCTGDNDTPACRANYAKGPDRQNDFGGTLGGPIWIPKIYNGHDRSFFFFSWEQFRQTVGNAVTSTVPTVAQRSGDFSQILDTQSFLGKNPCDGTPVYAGQIFDPATSRVVNGTPCRTAFPGNIIPTNRITPVAGNILKYYPLPQSGGLINNYTINEPYPINNTTYTVRIDQSFGQNSKIFGSYSTRENTSLKANRALPDPVDPGQWAQDFITHFFRLGWDYSFTPNVLNHFNFGTNRSNSKNFTLAALGKTNYASQLGISNIDSTNFPIISVGESIVNLSNGHNGDNIDNGFRLNDSIFWQKGRHALKFGTDIRLQQYSPINLPNPSFNFGRSETAATNSGTVASGAGNGFASLLLGAVDNATTQEYAHQPRWTSWFYGIFAQDDFKASNTLTLNLGIRWDVDQPRSEAENDTSNFDPNAIDPRFNIKGANVYGSNCSGCNTKWADTYYKDISPRIGFAWTPAAWNNKTVLRGGTAIFYGPLQYSDFGGSMTEGYSVTPNPVSTDGFTPAFNIDNGFPAYQKAPNLDPSIYDGRAVNGGYIKPFFGRPASVYSWSLQLQQQVTPNTVLAIGYVGNRASHLHSGFLTNDNNMPKSDFALGNSLTSTVDNNTVGVGQPFSGFDALWGPTANQVQRALRPFPQFTYIAGDCCLENLGHSSYDGLLVSLQRNFTNGLQFLASYTWSKNVTDADSALPFTNNGSNAAVAQGEDPTNLKLNKSISLQDIPHTFVISYLYELPFGKNKPFLNHGGWLNEVVGGWQVGGIQRYQTGSPISFGCASGIPGWDNCIRFAYTGKGIRSAAARAHRVNPLLNQNASDPNTNSYFNGVTTETGNALYPTDDSVAAFYDQNQPYYRGTGTYHFGNVPRVNGNVRLDSYFNEDFSVIKRFPIREGIDFSLKAEALNAFNRHTFDAVDTTPTDRLFGIPTGTVNTPRNMQITGRITF